MRTKVVKRGSHRDPVRNVRGVLLDADGQPVEDVREPDNSPPRKYRFRNRSGHPGHWEDEKGRRAELISQKRLDAIVAHSETEYIKGAWIEATLEQVGLDERQLWPETEPCRDGVIYRFNQAPEPRSGDAAGLFPELPPEPGGNWRVLKKFTGSSIKSTETFEVMADEWRISWATAPDPRGETNFIVDLRNPDGSLKDAVANTIGQRGDRTIIRGAGRYYLRIDTGQRYTITIEVPR